LKAKKFRARKISSSEGNSNRKDSVCSIASEPDEIKPLEEDLICDVPAVDEIINPVVVVQSGSKKPQPASIWDDMFPVLENSLSNLDITKSKVKPRYDFFVIISKLQFNCGFFFSEPRKSTGKLSQKQRRKISESEKEPTTPTSPKPRPFGWGKGAEQELSSPSLQDIIKEESKKAWEEVKGAKAIPIAQPIMYVSFK
jgi:hypothetical protein